MKNRSTSQKNLLTSANRPAQPALGTPSTKPFLSASSETNEFEYQVPPDKLIDYDDVSHYPPFSQPGFLASILSSGR